MSDPPSNSDEVSAPAAPSAPPRSSSSAARDDPPRGSDDELMMRFADGEAPALEALFRRYHRRVYHFARHLLADPGAAEEVLQDTFLAIARSASHYEPRGQFPAWLLTIARHQCLSCRARRRERSGAEALDQSPDPRPEPPRALEQKEHMSRLECAIQHLPDRQRQAILLYAQQQLTYVEIAQLLDAPVNTVKTLIHRARAALWRNVADG